MNKHSLLYIIIICACMTIPLVAQEEEGGDKAPFFKRKIIIKSLSTYGGLATGLMGGAVVGNCLTQDQESMGISLAKVGVGALVGGIAGTIAGRNIGHKFIKYYYPKEEISERL